MFKITSRREIGRVWFGSQINPALAKRSIRLSFHLSDILSSEKERLNPSMSWVQWWARSAESARLERPCASTDLFFFRVRTTSSISSIEHGVLFFRELSQWWYEFGPSVNGWGLQQALCSSNNRRCVSDCEPAFNWMSKWIVPDCKTDGFLADQSDAHRTE